jgi:hypothetical protein
MVIAAYTTTITLNNIQFLIYSFFIVKKSEHKKIAQKVKKNIKGGHML